jgi:hypothetical protein
MFQRTRPEGRHDVAIIGNDSAPASSFTATLLCGNSQGEAGDRSVPFRFIQPCFAMPQPMARAPITPTVECSFLLPLHPARGRAAKAASPGRQVFPCSWRFSGPGVLVTPTTFHVKNEARCGRHHARNHIIPSARLAADEDGVIVLPQGLTESNIIVADAIAATAEYSR